MLRFHPQSQTSRCKLTLKPCPSLLSNRPGLQQTCLGVPQSPRDSLCVPCRSCTPLHGNLPRLPVPTTVRRGRERRRTRRAGQLESNNCSSHRPTPRPLQPRSFRTSQTRPSTRQAPPRKAPPPRPIQRGQCRQRMRANPEWPQFPSPELVVKKAASYRDHGRNADGERAD